ncbi:hypothetical protein ACF0H5_000401 [Mactra antiquata]
MSLQDYTYEEDDFNITEEMKNDFDTNGFILVRGLFSMKEIHHIEKAVNTEQFAQHMYSMPDNEGRDARLILWNHPGNDVTGMVARCEKVAGTCEQLLGGEVYHYHTKLMTKPAKIGGQFSWHQDYGYWYKNGCLFPYMMTVFIAIDKCTKENSCLEILKGSNRCGRVDHVRVGGQQGADIERVQEIKKICQHEYVEMNPGDALFFHSNLLHSSGANISTKRRWAFLCAYNRADNNPTIEHHHPTYTPLIKVPNSSILSCKETSLDGKWFRDPEKDINTHTYGRKIASNERE